MLVLDDLENSLQLAGFERRLRNIVKSDDGGEIVVSTVDKHLSTNGVLPIFPTRDVLLVSCSVHIIFFY